MRNKLFIALVSASIISFNFISCKKDEIKDTEKPVINVTEPMMNDTSSMATEDSVHIMFTASDNDQLHIVNVNITNAAGANVFTSSADVDAKTYSFHQHFHPTGITGLTSYTLKIDASDHNENADSKIITFYVKP